MSGAGGVDEKLVEAECKVSEAYQIVGAIAHYAGIFCHPDVVRALDYLNGDEIEGEILPWPREPLLLDDREAQTLAAKIEEDAAGAARADAVMGRKTPHQFFMIDRDRALAAADVMRSQAAEITALRAALSRAAGEEQS